MAEYLEELASGLSEHAVLKALVQSGGAREEAEDMSRRELENAYVDIVGKFVELTEVHFQRLQAS